MDEVINEPRKLMEIDLKNKLEHMNYHHQVTSMVFNCTGYTLAISVS